MIKVIWAVRRDCRPLPALGRQRQEYHSKFKASLKNFNLCLWGSCAAIIFHFIRIFYFGFGFGPIGFGHPSVLDAFTTNWSFPFTIISLPPSSMLYLYMQNTQ